MRGEKRRGSRNGIFNSMQKGDDVCNFTRFVAVLVVAGVSLSGAVYAASDTAASSAEQKEAAVIDAGNKICPVTGEQVDGDDFYEYAGKRYGLCCPMCAATFKADPKKYSAIADKEIAGKN